MRSTGIGSDWSLDLFLSRRPEYNATNAADGALSASGLIRSAYTCTPLMHFAISTFNGNLFFSDLAKIIQITVGKCTAHL